jgi:hypothetical protein
VELTWWLVAIGGCVALAVCLVAVLVRPMKFGSRPPRALANLGRLTGLPEYRRAARLRTLTAVVTMALLVVIYTATVITGARPTGLPALGGQAQAAQPEDIMLCVGEPVGDPATSAMLQYFARQVNTFGTQRIGLTSPNRRVLPLTRDYQYAAAQFNRYGTSPDPQSDVGSWSPVLSYSDYAESVEDLLALCMTGFPSFDKHAAQRRSLIYLGPGTLPGAGGAQLFTADTVRNLATTAGIQVNVLLTGSGNGALEALARQTGGRSFSGDSDVAGHLSEIRNHPPAPTDAVDEGATVVRSETPGIAVLSALVALAALSLWPVVIRR